MDRVESGLTGNPAARKSQPRLIDVKTALHTKMDLD